MERTVSVPGPQTNPKKTDEGFHAGAARAIEESRCRKKRLQKLKNAAAVVIVVLILFAVLLVLFLGILQTLV